MKKLWPLLLIMLLGAALLGACQAQQKNSEAATIDDEITKAQSIAVVSADSGETLFVLEEQADIEDFINHLRLEEWQYTTLPENAVRETVFILSQEDTQLLGEDEKDGALHYVGSITTYRQLSYLSFEIAGLSFVFQIPDEASQYLRELGANSAG